MLASSAAIGQPGPRQPDSFAVPQTAARRAGSALTIDSVLALASVQHPLVEAARARVTASRGSRRTAAAFSNPLASYQVENAAYPGRNSGLPIGTQRETSTFVTLPIEPLFQRGSRIRRANEEVNAATAELAVAQQLVAQSAAHAFYDLATAQAVHDEADEEYDNYKRLLDYVRTRVKEGAAPEGDLLRVQVEVSRAATVAVTTNVTVIRAQSQLQLYLGVAPRTALSDSLRVTVPRSAVDERLLSAVESFVRGLDSRRPELAVARARSAAAAAGVTYQRTLLLRQLGAMIGNKRIGDVNTVMAGVTLPIPVFDMNRGEVQRASAEHVAAEQELLWEARKVNADLNAAHHVAMQLTRQLATLEPSFLDLADESRRVTNIAYEEGAASLVDVLNATRAYGEARLMYFRLLNAQRASLIDLAIAVGAPANTLLSQLTIPERDDSSRRRDDR